jgi:hypothetical protein
MGLFLAFLVSDFRPFSEPAQPKEPGPPSRHYQGHGQENAMSPVRKKDEYAGSGLDKPEPKSLVSRIADKLKTSPRPKAAASKPSAS